MKHKATKQILSILLAVAMLMGVLPMAAIPAFALDVNDIDAYESDYQYGYFLEDGTWIRLVYDWDDMDRVFQNLKSMDEYGYVTIKLMDDLSVYCGEDYTSDSYSIKSYEVSGPVSDWEDINIVFDFNGHTLNGTVEIGDVYSMANFINLTLLSGNQLTFTDSVGGGGINFSSKRHHDNNIAALHITSAGESERGAGYNKEDPDSYPAKVTFNGGTYEMSDSIEHYLEGTRIESIDYRGTVIADFVDVEINDGTFIANSGGVITTGGIDMCARELAAFGTVIESSYNFPAETYPSPGVVIPYEETGRTVINGGKFISDGYAVHHFDNSDVCTKNGVFESAYYEYPYKYTNLAYLDGHYHMNYPTINGGYFEGQLGFTGLTYTYSEGNSDLNSRPASEIIPEASIILGIDKDGNKITDVSDLNWKDLHDMQSCFVVPADSIKINTTPKGEGDPIELTRTVKQSDTFEMSWTVPSYLEGEVVCQPMITITRPKSNIEPKIYSDSKVTVNYSEYPNDVNVACELYLLAWGEALIFEQNYEVDVKRVYTATDSCMHCYATGDNGWDEIVEGETCAFVILPNDYYELTDPDALEVYVNGELVTPSGNGGYYVSNVTEDLNISCDGSAFTGYSNLIISANGKTVTEKLYVGETYTFKTLAEFGATVPENSTFTGWKIGGKTYQPGDTFTVKGTGEIAVNAAFTGLYNITVENGKAYADEAHTIPISAAAENQVVYIVADPAPEGKVFSYWSRTFAVVGGHGWFGDSEAAVTTFTVYDSDVVLTPVYETLVDEIVIGGMTKPSAGVAIDNSDYSYKWGCSVPADAGYTLGISYWYDITDGEPEFAMSSGDVFQIGHTYRFKARIHLKADHIYPANPEDIAVVLSGIDAEDYQCTINEVGYTSATIYFEFTCEEAPQTGVSLSGTVTSFGDEAEQTTVQLFPSGSEIPAFIVMLTGNTAKYSFEGVFAGTYTMKVMKKNHVTREYTVTVGSSNVVQDVKICLLGDVTGDGKVNTKDWARLKAHVNETSNLTGYELACGDVNGDSKVNIKDWARLKAHVNESNPLW